MLNAPDAHAQMKQYSTFFTAHIHMKAKQDKIVAVLRKKGLKAHLPRVLLEVLSDYILGTITCDTPLNNTHRLHHSLAAQANIGVDYLLCGYIAKQWTIDLQMLGLSHPSRAISWILQFI